LDFKKINRPEYNPRYSFFGGANLGNGVQLGIYGNWRGMSSSEGKKRMKEKFGRANKIESGDGKVTWEYYFTHWETPGIIYTVYDYKGGLSCGLGIPNDVYGNIEPRFAEKVNALLTELTDYAFGRAL